MCANNEMVVKRAGANMSVVNRDKAHNRRWIFEINCNGFKLYNAFGLI